MRSLLLLACLAMSCAAAAEDDDRLLRARLQAHIGFLAHDQLRGRQPGTEGHNIAAAYVASELNEPQRDLPRALIVGTTFVLFLYLGLNAVYLYGASWKHKANAFLRGENCFNGRVSTKEALIVGEFNTIMTDSKGVGE